MIKLVLFYVVALLLNQAIVQAKKIPTYNVIHSAQYGIQKYLLNDNEDNRMAIQFGSSSTLYILNKTTESLVHSGSFPYDPKLALLEYRYVIVDNATNILETETVVRSPKKDNDEIVYDVFGRISPPPIERLPVVHFSNTTEKSKNFKNDIDDRDFIHPTDQIPTWHFHIPSEGLSQLHEEILKSVTIHANLTRITKDKIYQSIPARIKLSGQTSRLFKKLSYNILIEKNATESFGGYRRFKIRSCATDPSYMREKIYYDILDSMRVPTAKASYIRLFINNEPQGLYLIVDHYKSPLFKNVIHSKSGGLIQGQMQENPLAVGKLKLGANLAYLGDQLEDYQENKTMAYEIKKKAHKGNVFKDLIDFMKFIDQSLKKETHGKKEIREWHKKLDVSLFLKHLALELLLGHGDGYLGAAHNYMLYQDVKHHRRFIWLSSDLDQTMGNTLKATKPISQLSNSTSWMDYYDRFGVLEHLSQRPLAQALLRIKRFEQQFHKILLDIRLALTRSDTIEKYIHNLESFIEPDVEWDQQLEPYRVSHFENKTLYEQLVYDKVTQLPVGDDFMARIKNQTIAFKDAVGGNLDNSSSIVSLVDWFRYLKN